MANNSNTRRNKRDANTSIMLNFCLFLLIFIVAAFLVDGFLLHPIAAPNGAFEQTHTDKLYTFDLFQSDSEYADAELIDSLTHNNDIKVYLVKENETYHLLGFKTHMYTSRSRMTQDIIIEDPNEPQSYSFGWLYEYAYIEIADGAFTDNSMISDQGLLDRNLTYMAYILVGVALAFLESVVYRKVTGKKWKKL